MSHGIKLLAAFGTACMMGAAVSTTYAASAQTNASGSAQNGQAQGSVSTSGQAAGPSILPGAASVFNTVAPQGQAGVTRVLNTATLTKSLGTQALGFGSQAAQAGAAKGNAAVAQGKTLAVEAVGGKVGEVLSSGKAATGLLSQGKALVLGAVPAGLIPASGAAPSTNAETPGLSSGSVSVSGAAVPLLGQAGGASASTPSVSGAKFDLGGARVNSANTLAGPELALPQLNGLMPQGLALSDLTAGSLPIAGSLPLNGAGLGL